MIKNIYEITIGDYSQMELSGKISQFKKWYNPFPTIFFIKKIQSVLNEVLVLLNENKINDEEDKFWKAKSILKIQQIEAAYYIIVNNLVIDIPLRSIISRIRIKRGTRRKFKDANIDSVKQAIEAITELTGLELNNFDKDLESVRLEIIRLKDKFAENFNKPKQSDTEQKKVSLMDYASSYILYTGGSFNGLSKMKIIELVALKKQAEKKLQAEKEMIEKLKANGRN